MFSKDLEYSIGQCYKQAREARHEFMTVEHLLLALLENPAALAVLKACGFNQPTLAADGLSSRASRRCSTVMNSWRASRACL